MNRRGFVLYVANSYIWLRRAVSFVEICFLWFAALLQ